MKEILIVILVASVLYGAALPLGQQDSDILSIANPESNILNKGNRDEFVFTVYPPSPTGWGNARNVADERQQFTNANWKIYGFATKPDSEGIAYVSVNLKRPYFVRAFAVTGFSGGSHKPVGPFFLEGSNDGNDWKMVAEGKPEQWHAPGTYPFRPSQIVKALYPGRYEYYRVIAKGWTNGYMNVQNWGLFT